MPSSEICFLTATELARRIRRMRGRRASVGGGECSRFSGEMRKITGSLLITGAFLAALLSACADKTQSALPDGVPGVYGTPRILPESPQERLGRDRGYRMHQASPTPLAEQPLRPPA